MLLDPPLLAHCSRLHVLVPRLAQLSPHLILPGAERRVELFREHLNLRRPTMKRLWLCLLPLALFFAFLPAAQSRDQETPEGFEALFNGKDLTGWKVNEGGKMSVWGAENGILYVDGRGGGWLMTEKEYGDFDLRLEFKIPEKGNSGVALRSPMKGDPAYAGMEIQILDDDWYKANYKGLKPTQHTGSIYDVVPPSKSALKPVGEWNKMRIVAKGRQVTIE